MGHSHRRLRLHECVQSLLDFLLAAPLPFSSFAPSLLIPYFLVTMYILYRSLNVDSAPPKAQPVKAPKSSKSSKRSATLPGPSPSYSSLKTSLSAPSLQTISEQPNLELNVSSVAPASERHHRRGPSKTVSLCSIFAFGWDSGIVFRTAFFPSFLTTNF